MLSYIWPIALVILSNIVYHICAKSAPESMNPFASLTVIYAIGAVVSAVLYYALNKGGSLIREYAHLNWTSVALGIAIVGLEAGFLYAYKAGWPVSTAQIVQSSVLAIALLIVGFLLYHEPLNVRKVIGVLICMVGLYFINR
ncbi:MAG: EamA family transporter [Clostridia bacterium]|nr:EamA family transporter [Clostridia bacterium]